MAGKVQSGQTRSPDPLASLYTLYAIDCVIKCAHFVSIDFSLRPKFYRDIKEPSVEQGLSDLQAKWGVDTEFPDEQDRAFLFGALFGLPLVPEESDEGDMASSRRAFETSGRGFVAAQAHVSERVKAFVEYKLDANRFGLGSAVASSFIRFKTHLEDVRGSSSRMTFNRIQSLHDLSLRILRNKAVSGVFGVTTDIDANWPIGSSSPEGARLIEQISRRQSEEDGRSIVVLQDDFIRLQRIARFGALCIDQLLNLNIDESLSLDVTKLDSQITPIASNWYVWDSELTAGQ